jgi:hypothetical protein
MAYLEGGGGDGGGGGGGGGDDDDDVKMQEYIPNKELKVQVVIFWVVTQCSVVVGYRRFRGVCWYPTASLSGVTTQNST